MEFISVDPERWSADTVAEVLTGIGLEVEEVSAPERMLQRFVVGRVTECLKHPKADKLHVCSVDSGEPELRTIVCGAQNVQQDQFVVVALDGAVVPNGNFTIAKRMLRGVESNGMICSAAELNLSDESDGIMVLGGPGKNMYECEGALVPGMPAAEALGLSTVYDVAITPNRADCLSHVGVARDLYAYGCVHGGVTRNVNLFDSDDGDGQSPNGDVRVEVLNAEVVPLYAIQRLTGVRNGTSPAWMQRRLKAAGLRPKNLIVDVTNYVNMESGQPLHAFDTAKLAAQNGAPTIVVRTADTVEPFVTLDGKQREIQPGTILICDAEKPVAVAGVMGGQNSEISDATTDVCIESAWFSPQSVRKTARSLALSTDASYRFERGVNPNGVLPALRKAALLILEYGGGTNAGVVVANSLTDKRTPITVRYQRIRDILGTGVPDETILTIVKAVGCTVLSETPEACTVLAPHWRADITIEADIAEEVMRLYGVDKIPEATTATVPFGQPDLPASVAAPGGSVGQARRREVRLLLKGLGFNEALNGVLVDPRQQPRSEHVMLRNALGAEYSALRTSLVPGLLRNIAYNRNHGAQTLRMFELGNVFSLHPNAEFGILQQERLALAVCGSTEEHWSRAQQEMDVFDVLGYIETLLGRSVTPTVAEEAVQNHGFYSTDHELAISYTLYTQDLMIGKAFVLPADAVARYDIDATVAVAELNMQVVDAVLQAPKHYHPVSPFPTVRRDVAFTVDEQILSQSILDVIAKVAGDSYLGGLVFDIYRNEQRLGANKKSVGVALRFGDTSRTLVDSEVDDAVSRIIQSVTSTFGASIRG